MDPITQIDSAFWNGLLTLLQNFTKWVTDQADGGAMVIMGQLISLIRSLNFVTHTDLALVNTIGNVFGWNEVQPLVDSVLKLGMVLAAICGAGHYYWGWRAIPDSVQRLFLTALLTRVALQTTDWSLQFMDLITGSVATSIPDFPTIVDLNPFILVILMLVWAWNLFQLALVAAERIAWLVILKPLAPLAFATWALPQTAWVAVLYTRMWAGWLLGQFFVILAIAALIEMISRGGLDGYIMSVACLIVARRAITALVPAGGEGFSLGAKVGPLKV